MNRKEVERRLARSVQRHWFEDFLTGARNYSRYFCRDYVELCMIGLAPNGIPPRYRVDENLIIFYSAAQPVREGLDFAASRLGVSHRVIISAMLSVCELPFDPPELDRWQGV